jgi:hypothetical protein
MIARRLRHGGPGRGAMSGELNASAYNTPRNETRSLSLMLLLRVNFGPRRDRTQVTNGLPATEEAKAMLRYGDE